jgi:glutamyl-tRNA synthetase
MSRDEIVERFTLEAVSASPGTFDYAKLDWMNGVHLRGLSPAAYADEVVAYLRDQGCDWPEDRVRAMAPLVQEKVGRLGEIPAFTGFLFGEVEHDPGDLDARILAAAARSLAGVAPWTAETLETALKSLCEELGEKPRKVYAPIRVAVTGSRVSPGLYESLELLGPETSLARIRRGAELAG